MHFSSRATRWHLEQQRGRISLPVDSALLSPLSRRLEEGLRESARERSFPLGSVEGKKPCEILQGFPGPWLWDYLREREPLGIPCGWWCYSFSVEISRSAK